MISNEIESLRDRVEDNYRKGLNQYYGFESHEIGTLSRHEMFGDISEDEWDEWEWSQIVD